MLELRPFEPNPLTQLWAVTVIPAHQCDQLFLCYQLTGPMDQLELPAPMPPTRADNLWTTTCFEFFLAIPETEAYWEINVSPSGCWNVYAFKHYREQMQAEAAFTTMPLEITRSEKQFALSLKVDLTRLNLQNTALELGITTVLKTKAGDLSYWAIAHTGPEADFHRRDSFVYWLS